MTTVVIVDDAAAQLAEIVAWWEANRPAAPTLVLDELERAVLLLESTPDVGARFDRSAIPGVRRLTLKRSKVAAYYLHDAARSIVYILAFWGAPRAGFPPLRDPR